jgi:hypothetical protein
MSSKTIVSAILILIVAILSLFILPSTNQSVTAEQSLYSGNENHSITLQEGAALAKAYRINASANDVLAHYFGKNALKNTLEQPGCVGLRLYYGKHADGSPAIVVVGVDSKGNDMSSGLICQRTWACPPVCDNSSSELKQDNTFANLR